MYKQEYINCDFEVYRGGLMIISNPCAIHVQSRCNVFYNFYCAIYFIVITKVITINN